MAAYHQLVMYAEGPGADQVCSVHPAQPLRAYSGTPYNEPSSSTLCAHLAAKRRPMKTDSIYGDLLGGPTDFLSSRRGGHTYKADDKNTSTLNTDANRASIPPSPPTRSGLCACQKFRRPAQYLSPPPLPTSLTITGGNRIPFTMPYAKPRTTDSEQSGALSLSAATTAAVMPGVPGTLPPSPSSKPAAVTPDAVPLRVSMRLSNRGGDVAVCPTVAVVFSRSIDTVSCRTVSRGRRFVSPCSADDLR